MNIADLQHEGLSRAVAPLNRLLADKAAISSAKAAIAGDERLSAEIPPANRDAAHFPVHLLQLAETVGRSKRT
jgi:hypothetical protein